MRARVFVVLRAGVLDTQGKAVASALIELGFGEVQGARVGKLIELELAGSDRAAAESRVNAMCAQLLANSVIETYSIEIISESV